MEERSFGIIPIRIKNNKREYLLIQSHAENWGFPKGHKNPGETNKEAAQRELFEETGLKLEKFISSKPQVESFVFRRAGKIISKQVRYYPGMVAEGKVKIQPEEIKDYSWLTYDKAMERLSFPEAKKILQVIEGFFVKNFSNKLQRAE